MKRPKQIGKRGDLSDLIAMVDMRPTPLYTMVRNQMRQDALRHTVMKVRRKFKTIGALAE